MGPNVFFHLVQICNDLGRNGYSTKRLKVILLYVNGGQLSTATLVESGGGIFKLSCLYANRNASYTEPHMKVLSWGTFTQYFCWLILFVLLSLLFMMNIWMSTIRLTFGKMINCWNSRSKYLRRTMFSARCIDDFFILRNDVILWSPSTKSMNSNKL